MDILSFCEQVKDRFRINPWTNPVLICHYIYIHSLLTIIRDCMCIYMEYKWSYKYRNRKMFIGLLKDKYIYIYIFCAIFQTCEQSHFKIFSGIHLYHDVGKPYWWNYVIVLSELATLVVMRFKMDASMGEVAKVSKIGQN